ncbi:hypothetical protein IW140_004191 [Coemansia sp. RSA 1813]|nr:hypothetical protein EV178_002265 [Coemansia sp. RSA 1646]KAJ1765276.1 hypothetical protein LPJ74_006419 [Coemansia sp. RSA 1843]KAJ2090025.1 hypothetical protein IW138_002994 [Coemansia sp. RSA 986]KAJ2217015.1 hypothetical protein EV179_000782 [Coemansia sp. RSA 487]KAJ2568102.1 hypothetical protein IW140_004191 [Coemansia sp. RSA 1813]
MRFYKYVPMLLLAGAAVVSGLSTKEEQAVTDILTIMQRGTSIYPLDDLLHNLAQALGFTHTARRLSRFVPGSKEAHRTLYDMLIYLDINGKHTPEQHEKLRQLTNIIGSKVLKISERDVSFHTLVVQEEEEDDDETDNGEEKGAKTSAVFAASHIRS